MSQPSEPLQARQSVFLDISSSDENEDEDEGSDDEIGGIEDCDTGSPMPQQTSSKPHSTKNRRKRARPAEDESVEEETPQTNRQRIDSDIVPTAATNSVVDFLDGAVVGCFVC